MARTSKQVSRRASKVLRSPKEDRNAKSSAGAALRERRK